jgi:ComF family protein
MGHNGLVAKTVQSKFQWPPKAAPETAAPADSLVVDAPEPVVLPPIERPAVALWRELEAAWLEPRVPAFAVRMLEARWEPDAPSAYCNQCGVSIGLHEQQEFGCGSCRDIKWPWDRFVRLGEYDGVLRHWIHEVKFRRWRAVGVELGRMLGESLRLAGCSEDAVLVPLPMPRGKRMWRGIDHTSVLAQGIRQATGYSIVRALRARLHRSQRLVVPSQRAGNVAGVFRAVGAERLAGRAVVLVDDVRTTGSSLAACARVLRESMPEGGGIESIWVCAVGVTPEHGRKAVGEQAGGLG